MQTRTKAAAAVGRDREDDKVKNERGTETGWKSALDEDYVPSACDVLSVSRGTRFREAKWGYFVNKEGASAIKDGAMDPIRYDLVARKGKKLAQTWCTRCLGEWREEWKARRRHWWEMLDGWLGLV